MLKVVRFAMHKEVSLWELLGPLGHIVLMSVPVVTPFALFFATLYILGRLSSDSAELVAMRSLGLSRLKLLVPFLVVATVVGGAVLVLNNRIIPYSKREYRKSLALMASKGVVSDIRRGSFFTSIPNTILFAETTEDGGKRMGNVFIHTKSTDGKERTIFAKEGELSRGEKSNMEEEGPMQFILRDGSILSSQTGSSDIEKILFQEYYFPLKSDWSSSTLKNKSSMKSSWQLYHEIQAWKQLTTKTKRQFRKMRKAEVELFWRFNTPLLCIIFTFLGFSLGIQRVRGRSKGLMPLALGILVSYYVLFFGGIDLAKDGVLPVPVSIFFPSLVILGAGIYFYRKLKWVV